MIEEQNHEVVISGVAGLFPECDDVDELWSRLMNKDENMVTVDDRRWVPGELGVPPGVGKVKTPNHFDMTFFGVSRRLCLNMDPLTKLCMEQSFRAVCDAGVNPTDLSGSNVAVLMASVSSETEYDCVIRGEYQGHAMLGHSRTMQANRISYFMNLKGPSLMMDSSWCGGIQGIQYGYDLVKGGHATSALVGACSLVYRPEVSTHYLGVSGEECNIPSGTDSYQTIISVRIIAMGRLSHDNKTRSLSADASGYARSEGCVVFFIQRKDHARRSYGTILNATSLTIGSRLNPFAELSEEDYRNMLLESYKKAKAAPENLGYYEASGIASKECDARELRAVSDALLSQRVAPLPVGCIKSNLGHCEGAASMVGAIKAALVLDRGVIPPNINYTAPNPSVPALVSGRLQVVTEPTPLQGNIVACTEFGAACQFSHIILQQNDKVKPTNRKLGELPPDGLPRLVLMSDRTDTNLEGNRKRLEEMTIDEELVCLMNHVVKDGIKGHLYRGYTVLSGMENKFKQVEQYQDDSGKRRPIWFMFSGMGSQWPTMGKTLMRHPIFAEAIQKCHDILAPKGVSVLDIVTNEDPATFDTILHSFIGIAAIQIGLVDVLHALGIRPDGIVGHSVGELGCAYADGCFTAEQMILAAYARGRASVEATLIRGMMAAVGQGYQTIKNQIPESIEVACHNSSTSCTLSGPAKDMDDYIQTLKSKGVFAKLVNVANIAYHSRYIKPAAPALLRYLKEVVPEPKRRSSRWVSSSIPESQWGSDLAQSCSAEYHTNNLLSSVLFEEATAHVPADAIVIEIAPHGLLQAIVRRSMPKATHIPLTNRMEDDNLMFLLGAIGKMYMHGIPVDVHKLYPPVSFPVSRGTPAISPFIGWQHDEEFDVTCFDETSCRKVPCWKELNVLMTEAKYSNLSYHKMKGKVVLPVSFYVTSALELYSDYDHTVFESCVSIENLDYRKDVVILQSNVGLFLQLQRGTANFSFFHSEDLVAKGRICKLDKSPITDLTGEPLSGGWHDGGEVAAFFNTLGLNLSGPFDKIEKYSLKNNLLRAVVQCTGSVTEFLGNIFTLVGFVESKIRNELRIVSRVARIIIDFTIFNSIGDVQVEYDSFTKMLKCDRLQVFMAETSVPTELTSPTGDLAYSFETYEFVPFANPDLPSVDSLMSVCSQLVMENLNQYRDKASTVRVIGIGKDLTFFHTLNAQSQLTKKQHWIHFSSVMDEDEFYQRDRSSIYQEIIWLIATESPSQKILKSLDRALSGFILMPKADASRDNVNIMMEFTHSGRAYVLGSFTRKHKPRNFTPVDTNDSYLEVLSSKLEKAAEENYKNDEETNFVILTGQLESITSAVAVIEETISLPNSNLLRYMFVDEARSPALSSNEIKIQISKDLKQNIFSNGVWGSLRLLPVCVDHCSTNENRSIREKCVYPFSSMVSTSEIRTVGLNLTDVTGALTNDNLGLFDYVSGAQMGIAAYDDKLKTFSTDPVLKWRRPNTWTDAEAATVPLLYSLAVKIVYFSHNTIQTEIDTILVTRGLLPLSQAIIRLALHEKLEVFTTTGSDEETAKLLAMFPKLKPKHILDHTRNDFYMHIKRMRKGRGLDKIVCTLEEESGIVAAVKSLPSHYGSVIMVSQAAMNDQAKLGLLMFLEEAVAIGVTPDSLISSSNQMKVELRDKLQSLIEIGVIKPFQHFTTLPSSTYNVDAVPILQISNKKVVVDLNSQVSRNHSLNKFICDKTKNYVIICGQRHLDFWLDLAEWLLKRDARKLTVFLTQTALPTVSALRYHSLTDQYNGAKVNLLSMKHISSKASTLKFIDESKDKIHTIFFVGTDLRGKIVEIDDALRQLKSDCGVVCLGHGGEVVCHKRHEDGLKGLCVRCGMNELSSPDLLQYLEQLILKSADRPIVVLKEQLSQFESSVDNRSGESYHVPETLPELIELLRLANLNTPKLAGVATHSARQSFVKEVGPLYIVPGLRPYQMTSLVDQLFYPALEVRLPENCQDMDTAVSTLVHQMTTRPVNMFTIVADGWGGILALHIGAKLEALGKRAKVILLDGAPSVILEVASELLHDETALIDKYLKLSSKVESSVRNLTKWEDKLEAAVAGSSVAEEEKPIAARALDMLRNRLLAVYNNKAPSNKILTKCHLFKRGASYQETNQSGLSDYLIKEHIRHLMEGETVADSMRLAADDINSLALFEYRDAAYPQSDDQIGVNILKNTCFDN